MKSGTSHSAVSFPRSTTVGPSVSITAAVAPPPPKAKLLLINTTKKHEQIRGSRSSSDCSVRTTTVIYFQLHRFCFRRQRYTSDCPPPYDHAAKNMHNMGTCPPALPPYVRLDREIRYTFTETGIKGVRLTQTVTSTGERYQLDSFVMVKVQESSDRHNQTEIKR